MNIDETVKALRGECKLRYAGINCEGCEFVGEKLAFPYYKCNLIDIATDQLEQLDRDLKAQIQHGEKLAAIATANAKLVKKREKAIKQLQAENERLKAEKPVRCEVVSHSEKEIVEGCITLMQWLTGKFKEYLEFVGFEPECEEERFSVNFYMSEIVRTLLLSGTSHSGGTSTAQKCKELGFDYSKIIEFDFEEGTE